MGDSGWSKVRLVNFSMGAASVATGPLDLPFRNGQELIASFLATMQGPDWIRFPALLFVLCSLAALVLFALAWRRAALFDPLTNLANRSLFLRHLMRAMDRRGAPGFAVMLLDIDRFRSLNDSLGHPSGDALLRQVAERLRSTLDRRDMAARLGNDEFAVLLAGADNAEQADRCAERVQERLAAPFLVGDVELCLTACIGLTMAAEGYRRPEHLLRDADNALHRAKAAGAGERRHFDRRMHLQTVAAFNLEGELREALARAQLELRFQPLFRLRDGQLSGFEALLRWRHPERGVLSPGEFLRAAESTGLIVSIESWVLPEACRRLRAWQQRFAHAEHLAMSVNLASQHFLQPHLPERVAGALAVAKLPPRSLRIEITESTLMEQRPIVRENLAGLRRLGVHLDIDDFGTGHSSLSYLRQLPATGLKIDRSFVQDLQRDSAQTALPILRSIVQLGQNLGLRVVAEGIETNAELELLRRIGCEYGQGYLLGRPLDDDAVDKLLHHPYFGGLPADGSLLSSPDVGSTPTPLRVIG